MRKLLQPTSWESTTTAEEDVITFSPQAFNGGRLPTPRLGPSGAPMSVEDVRLAVEALPRRPSSAPAPPTPVPLDVDLALRTGVPRQRRELRDHVAHWQQPLEVALLVMTLTLVAGSILVLLGGIG